MKLNITITNENIHKIIKWFEPIYVGSMVTIRPEMNHFFIINSENYQLECTDNEAIIEKGLSNDIVFYIVNLDIDNKVISFEISKNMSRNFRIPTFQKLINKQLFSLLDFESINVASVLKAIITFKKEIKTKNIDYITLTELENKQSYFKLINSAKSCDFIDETSQDDSYIIYKAETIDDLDKHFTIYDDNTVYCCLYSIERLTDWVNYNISNSYLDYKPETQEIKVSCIKKCAIMMQYIKSMKFSNNFASLLTALCLSKTENKQIRLMFNGKENSPFYELANTLNNTNENIKEMLIKELV